MSTESSRKPSDLFPIKTDEAREAAGPAPMSTFQMWRAAISRPSVELYEAIAQHPQARITTALSWVLLTSLIFYGVISLISWLGLIIIAFHVPSFSLRYILAFDHIALLSLVIPVLELVITFAVENAVLHIIGRLLGGKGTFKQLIYLTAAFTAPFLLICSGVIVLAVCFGVAVALVNLPSGIYSFPMLVGLVILLIYLLRLIFLSARAVYRFGGGKAFAALVLAGISLIILASVWSALWASDSDIHPPEAVSSYNRGLVHASLGNYSAAVFEYNKAITLDGDWAEVYNSRGLIYYAQKKYSSAIYDFNQAIALDPNNPNAYNNRGLIYDVRGQHDDAIADYNQALALDPQLAITYQNRALVYDQQGQSAQALADYRRYVELVGEASVPPEIRQRIAELERLTSR